MLFEKIELETDEEVHKVLRKHWFIIATELFAVFCMFLVPFFLLFMIALFPNTLNFFSADIDNLLALVSYGLAAWSLIMLMSGFAIWTHYYLDLWIITDRRIILVDQIHFFNRDVSMIRLERLQDINVSVSGVIPTLLNFGTIKVQSAGAHASHFKTAGLPDPRNVQAIIQLAMDKRIAALYHKNPTILE